MAEGIVIINEQDAIKFRTILAKILSKSMSQKRISENLGITQPMVSNYLASSEEFPEELTRAAKIVARKINSGITPYFNHSVTFAPISGEYSVAKEEELITDYRHEVVDNLLRALNMMTDLNFKRLLPKVKVNFAMCTKDATTIKDTASVGGGLVFIENNLAYFGNVGFNYSSHLAEILLQLTPLGIRSVINVRYDDDLTKNNYAFLSKDFKVKTTKPVDILLHKGAFGIEPCAYVVGKDALDVVEKLSKL